ncbi:MAG: TonB-dependent receptor [Akkermansia sp.]|nr:TonB-dependent receptor [Akkermansia sp.]
MKHRYRATQRVAYVVVPALLAAGGVLADTQETELAPITVSAHGGLAVPYDQTGVSVEVVDLQQMKQEGIYTVSEALTTLPGVYVLPGGGANQKGNTSQIVIRGMSADGYTTTMIDGMRLGSNGGDTIITSNVLGRTDIFSLGNLEVLKGSQGAMFGGGAVGGVVFMETPEGEGDPSLTLFNEVGSNNAYTGNVATQGRVDNLAWFLSMGYSRTDNDVQTADGRRSHHRNAFESEIWNEALRLDYHADKDNQLTLTYRREDSEYGYDSMDPMWPTYNNYRFRSNLLTAKWQTKISEQWRSYVMAGFYTFDAKLADGYLQDMRNMQLEWRNNYQWCKHQSTTTAISWNRNDYDCLSGGTTDNQYKNLENVLGFAAEHSITPTEQWDNTLAARLDHSNIHDALVSIRAASTYRFNEEKTRVYGSLGTGYRAPSSFQRSNSEFVSPYGKYTGNPQLDCEKSISADIGIEHALTDNHLLSLTLFWEQRSNAIGTVWDNTTQSSRYVNMPGHWTILGTEIALRGTLEPHWNTGYSVSWTYVQPKTSDDRQIPSSVRQVWQADLHTSPVEGLTTGIGVSAAVGRSHYNTTPYSKLDNYYNLRLYAQYQVNEHLTLHMAIENLTNQKYVTEGHYADPNSSFISAGTTLHAGCTITF